MDEQPTIEALTVIFPLNGLDTSDEFGGQRSNTTAIAVNVRALDPFQERARGGSRHGLRKYPNQQLPSGSVLVQHLNQIVLQSGEFLLSSFEDFQPDFIPSPSNPTQDVPPEGNGFQPNHPLDPRRRVQAVPSAVTAVNETTITITATLTRQTAGTFIGSETVVLTTNPPGMDGDGDTGVTDVNGVAVFSVSEPTYEGQIQYTVYNEYDTPCSFTVRGTCAVFWKPAYTLELESPDGESLPADGVEHDLVATLTKTLTGVPVRGRQLKLKTTPSGEVGHNKRKFTDSSGEAVFRVSDLETESVEYSVSLVPKPATSQATISENLTIEWGDGDVCPTCNSDVESTAPEMHGDPPEWLGYDVRWTLRTFSGPLCADFTDVTHVQGFFYIFPGGSPPTFVDDVQDITTADSPFMTEEEQEAAILALTAPYESLLAEKIGGLC